MHCGGVRPSSVAARHLLPAVRGEGNFILYGEKERIVDAGRAKQVLASHGALNALPSPRIAGRGWPKAGRGALFARCMAGAFTPHPALRATFSPLCGEKETSFCTGRRNASLMRGERSKSWCLARGAQCSSLSPRRRGEGGRRSRGALFARCIAAAFAPHPSLRATFSPRSGEKENQCPSVRERYARGSERVAEGPDCL